ncbi:MAG: IclR family transcriptional regulator [Betaproteobacteria bacterium]|nr:IclR family transcriptional regulator [Betaproteobacteria bacterium]
MANTQAPVKLSSSRRPLRRATPGAADKLPVRAVQRAFDLLALLGAERPGATLSELARDSTLPVSTVARLLATLEQSGFVRRDPDNRYRPGTRLVQIGLASLRSFSIYDLSEPHLRRLSETSGETANLAVRADAHNAIYLRQVLSPRTIHHAAWLGRILPIRKTAAGAALAGEVNAEGYVARRDTLDQGVTAIAAPVHGPGDQVIAAFSITGPSFRIGERDLARFGLLVAKEARLASAEIGARQLVK